MKFTRPLTQATLIKRYKRFLADVRLADNSELTIHCPNTGSMQGCNISECTVWFSTIEGTKRKYPQTWEIIAVKNDLIGINTHRANHLVEEAINNQVIIELQGYETIKREIKYGEQNSRIDLYLEKPNEKCYVEVKNVTLLGHDGMGYFPDAVTQRGTKHLQELIYMKQLGHRAVLCFCVQHTGINQVQAAAHIDPTYAATLQQARNHGVEIIAYKAAISPTTIELERSIDVIPKAF